MSAAARRGVHGHARLEAPHGDDLLWLPELEGEGGGSPLEDGVGAVIKGVKRGNHAAAPDPDKTSVEEVSQELDGQLASQIVPGQGKSRNIQRLQTIFQNCVNWDFISFQKFIWQNNWSSKNCLSQGKTSVLLSCARRLRSAQGISSAQVAMQSMHVPHP